MDDTLAQWLALREPWRTARLSIRRAGLSTVDVMRAIATRGQDPLRVLDLATGTGANIRYLMPRFPVRRQHWLAVDHSPTLLAQLPIRMSFMGSGARIRSRDERGGCVVRDTPLACHVETRTLDLDTLDADVFANRHVVTASALLDLVSEEWLRSLAARCRAAGAAALFTITYNGRSSCSPAEPEDDADPGSLQPASADRQGAWWSGGGA